MLWYNINFSETDIINNKPQNVLSEFKKLYKREFEGLALFSENNVTTKSYTYYLSIPKIYEEILQRYLFHHNAKSCDKPKVENITFLWGDRYIDNIDL